MCKDIRSLLKLSLLIGVCLHSANLYASDNGFVEGKAADNLVKNGKIIAKHYQKAWATWLLIVNYDDQIFNCEIKLDRHKKTTRRECWR